MIIINLHYSMEGWAGEALLTVWGQKMVLINVSLLLTGTLRLVELVEINQTALNIKHTPHSQRHSDHKSHHFPIENRRQ